MVVNDNERPMPPTPVWWDQYQQTYMSGSHHAYAVAGDIEGTALENIPVRGFILANLAARRDVVAVYHIAGGITLYEPDEVLEADERRKLPKMTRRERALAAIGMGGADAQAATAGKPVGSVAALLQNMGPASAPPDDPFASANRPAQAVDLLGRLLTEGKRIAVVIDHADALVPNPPMSGKGAMSPEDRRILVSLLVWAKDDRIGDNGNVVFLLARDRAELHADLRASDSGWKAIDIPLPDRAQRADYIDWYLARREERGRAIPLRDGLGVAELANLTAGLSLRNIEDVLLTGAQAGGLTRIALKAHKDAIIAASYSDVAEMIDPLPGGFADLGGAESFKTFCQRRIIAQVKAGRDKNVARGVLLVGPPGTSKTFGARALAGEIAFTTVGLKTEKILGGIVGQSEQKLATFFGFVRALAPCVVFVDEFDQTDMAQRGDTSGNPVAKNLFNALMQFMSDETLRGKVIVIMASNRPDKIDPAMIRSGRIDAIIPMLLPERDQRAAIVRVQARTQETAISEDAVAYLADNTPDWNAADLAEVVREARMLADDRELAGIGVDEATEALDDMRPSGLDTAQTFTLLAVKAVNKKHLLPERYRALLNDRQALATQIEAAPAIATTRPERGEREW